MFILKALIEALNDYYAHVQSTTCAKYENNDT